MLVEFVISVIGVGVVVWVLGVVAVLFVVVFGWVCVCAIARSFSVADMDRSSSVILFMVFKSSSTLVDSWLSFSLSLLMLFSSGFKSG